MPSLLNYFEETEREIYNNELGIMEGVDNNTDFNGKNQFSFRKIGRYSRYVVHRSTEGNCVQWTVSWEMHDTSNWINW